MRSVIKRLAKTVKSPPCYICIQPQLNGDSSYNTMDRRPSIPNTTNNSHHQTCLVLHNEGQQRRFTLAVPLKVKRRRWCGGGLLVTSGLCYCYYWWASGIIVRLRLPATTEMLFGGIVFCSCCLRRGDAVLVLHPCCVVMLLVESDFQTFPINFHHWNNIGTTSLLDAWSILKDTRDFFPQKIVVV